MVIYVDSVRFLVDQFMKIRCFDIREASGVWFRLKCVQVCAKCVFKGKITDM